MVLWNFFVIVNVWFCFYILVVFFGFYKFNLFYFGVIGLILSVKGKIGRCVMCYLFGLNFGNLYIILILG